MKYLAAIILFIGIVTTCVAQPGIDTVRFYREIPVYKSGDTSLFYRIPKQHVKQLKLDQLENGFDSLEIRIWYNYSFISNRNVLIIKRQGGEWTATAFKMEVEWNAKKKTEWIIDREKERPEPQNGWDNFLTKLFALQVMTLPDMDRIPGLSDGWTDGVSYDVEVATKNQYRFYSYHLPEKFADHFPEAANMVKILELVEMEFGMTNGIK